MIKNFSVQIGRSFELTSHFSCLFFLKQTREVSKGGPVTEHIRAIRMELNPSKSVTLSKFVVLVAAPRIPYSLLARIASTGETCRAPQRYLRAQDHPLGLTGPYNSRTLEAPVSSRTPSN